MNELNIGERIHNVIDDRRISQTALAQQLGIKLQTLNGYMTGRTKFPPHIIAQIASILEISTDYMLGLTNSPDQPIRLSKTEQLMVKKLRGLYRDQQEAVHNQVQFFWKQNHRE